MSTPRVDTVLPFSGPSLAKRFPIAILSKLFETVSLILLRVYTHVPLVALCQRQQWRTDTICFYPPRHAASARCHYCRM